MDISEDENLLSAAKILKLRKDKIKNEIAAATRLLNQNVEPLEIVDKFLHGSFLLMKQGITLRNPNYSEDEVKLEIKKTLSVSERIKSSQKRRRDSG